VTEPPTQQFQFTVGERVPDVAVRDKDLTGGVRERWGAGDGWDDETVSVASRTGGP